MLARAAVTDPSQKLAEFEAVDGLPYDAFEGVARGGTHFESVGGLRAEVDSTVRRGDGRWPDGVGSIPGVVEPGRAVFGPSRLGGR